MANAVEELVRGFVANLERVVRAQVTDEVGRAVRVAIGRAGATVAGRPGSKRTPEQIAKVGEKLVAYIAKHPRERAEQIAKGSGISTLDMALPIKHLLAAKRIKVASGVARGTTYVVSK